MLFFLLFSINFLLSLTQAVTVRISGPAPLAPPSVVATHVEIVYQVCSNLRPGRCCQERPRTLVAGVPPPPFPTRVVSFEGLEVLDVAAAWQPQGHSGGCKGTPAGTSIGPGNWRFPAEGAPEMILTGASYLKIPTKIPAGREHAPLMEAQGVLGLLTGGGGWVSSLASDRLRQQILKAASSLGGSALQFSPRRRSEIKRRGIISRDKGIVFTQPPPGVQWPDLITVNGTNYREESVGSPIYRNDEGAVLDFKDVVL